jgi:hypothetical protein
LVGLREKVLTAAAEMDCKSLFNLEERATYYDLSLLRVLEMHLDVDSLRTRDLTNLLLLRKNQDQNIFSKIIAIQQIVVSQHLLEKYPLAAVSFEFITIFFSQHCCRNDYSLFTKSL